MAEIKRKSIITDSAIIISVLTLLLALLLINRQQVMRKKDKMIFEKTLVLYEQEKKRVEGELANATIQLDEYIKSMVEKNALLEQFKFDLENIRNLKAREIDENRIEHLEQLNKTTILTEEDWSKFRELFEQVYKGFLIRLKEKFPDLSQAEVRLICLTKLNLDTKQMAGILGVSSNSIIVTRHRLRKKLGLSDTEEINSIANSI
jgi:DNA-binding CsgD family transcriptional regulator